MNIAASSSEAIQRIRQARVLEFRRNWRVVALGFFGVCIAPLPVFLYIFGALVQPLQEHFGWSRPELQISVSFAFGGLAIATQLIGWVNRRWGMRNVTVWSLVAISLTWAIMPFMLRSIQSLYAFAFLLTLLGLGATQITWSNLVILWFDRSRGIALSLILCGSGLAASIFSLMVTSVIGRWGWQSAFWLMAVFPVGVVLPMTLVWLRTPSRAGHDDLRVPLPVTGSGVAFSEGIRSSKFWLLAIALSVVVACVLSMISLCIPLLRDKGFSADAASKIFGVVGLSLIGGRIMVGYLIDRFWAPAIGAIVFSGPAVAALLLMNMSVSSAGMAIVAMVLIGIGTGAELDLGAYLVSRYFGTHDYGRLFGVHLCVNTVASLLAPLVISKMYAATSGYDSALPVIAACLAGASVAVLFLGRYPTALVARSGR